MELSQITVTDFKAFFRRDFLYLPVWDDTRTYMADAVVWYEVNELFYKCKENGTTADPTDEDAWELVAGDVDDYVLDEDIEKAFAEAQTVFNKSLFGTDDQVRIGYLYLTAHYLVNDLRTSMRGIQSTGENIMSSRTVGSVSESYAIPTAWTENPLYNFLAKTGYGLKYLSMILPRMVGNIGTVAGWTNP